MELKHAKAAANNAQSDLLIVPYGIETPLLPYGSTAARTFNRTLWN